MLLVKVLTESISYIYLLALGLFLIISINSHPASPCCEIKDPFHLPHFLKVEIFKPNWRSFANFNEVQLYLVAMVICMFGDLAAENSKC